MMKTITLNLKDGTTVTQAEKAVLTAIILKTGELGEDLERMIVTRMRELGMDELDIDELDMGELDKIIDATEIFYDFDSKTFCRFAGDMRIALTLGEAVYTPRAELVKFLKGLQAELDEVAAARDEFYRNSESAYRTLINN